MIGAACVMDPVTLLQEIHTLEEAGIPVGSRLTISGKTHLTHPAYRLLEHSREEAMGQGRIGTTGRGIGPTYEMKFRRCGLRLEDALNREGFKAMSESVTGDFAVSLKLSEEETQTLREEAEIFTEATFKVVAWCGDVSRDIGELLKRGERVIAEGAQGSLLDPDHGSYPFVTCGQCVAGGACSGLGFGPTQVDRVHGVLKAYTTRVGAGPFPTEQDNETGQGIRRAGNEYGTTTGRPRRCGWLDGVLGRYTAELNGCTSVTVTLLDVLSGLGDLKICTGYRGGELRTGRGMENMVPEYATLPGWTEDIKGETRWNSLPAAARNYVETIEKVIGVTVDSVSTGPRREDVIWR